MERRLPASLAAGEHSSIRKRSGGVDNHYRLFSDSPVVLQSSSNITAPRNLVQPQTLTVQVEDTDPIVTKPKILSVHCPAAPLEDRSRLQSKDLPLPPQDSSYSGVNAVAFSEVPLTPRLNRDLIDESSKPALSRLRMIHERVAKSKQLFPLSRFFSRQPIQHEPLPSSVTPHAVRLPERSSSSSSESGSGRSINLSRTSSLSSESSFSSSSVKFTQKWPKPRLNPRAIGGLVAALEDSEGIGMNKVDSWTTHKWVLLISLNMIFAYSFAGLICAILTWFRGWEHADVMHVADADILALITIASSILLFTALVGMCGTILNSRPILAIYSILLWTAFISLAVVGYVAYKRSVFSLDRKLNLAWSQWYNPASRLVIQNSLHCCGYYNALHEATPSKRCFPRTTLPGCKGKLFRFEKQNLDTIWTVIFALVPLHLIVLVSSLLCSNYVTRTFGKGIMPRQYRLNRDDVKVDQENLFSKFKDGVISRPALSRASSSAMFREDKAQRRPLLCVQEED